MFDEVNDVPKPSYKRRKPKRGNRSEFSQKIKKEVFDENGGLCEMCGSRWISDFHHVKNRSQMGRGVKTNCCGLCSTCHDAVTVTRKLQIQLQNKYIEKYGENYYKDEWDT